MLYTAQIPRRFIRAALITAAVHDIRYYLNGVLIEIHTDRVFVVSTDGHRASIFRHDLTENIADVPKGGVQFIITDDLAKTVKSGRTLTEISVSFDTATQNATIGTHGYDSVTSARVIDAKYPNWRRILPSITGELGPFYGDPVYIGDTAKIAKALGAKTVDLYLHSQGDTNVALVSILSEPGYRGVIKGRRRMDTNIPSNTGFSDMPEYVTENVVV